MSGPPACFHKKFMPKNQNIFINLKKKKLYVNINFPGSQKLYAEHTNDLNAFYAHQ